MPGSANPPPVIPTTEVVNPISAAFQAYLLLLEEQHSGALAQFALNSNFIEFLSRSKKQTYSTEGRLFFSGFLINGDEFVIDKSGEELTSLLTPIKTALNATEASLQQNAPTESVLNQFAALRRAALQSTLAYLKKSKTPAYKLLDEALTSQASRIQSLIAPALSIPPTYNLGNIKQVLDYRETLKQGILTKNGINLLHTLLVPPNQNPDRLTELRSAQEEKIAGAILFKIISAAEKLLGNPLPAPLKKFITKVANNDACDPETILHHLQRDYSRTLEKLFSPESILKYINEKNKDGIKACVSAFESNLESCPNDSDFAAFQPYSFSVLFSQLAAFHLSLAKHRHTYKKFIPITLNFIEKTMNQFETQADTLNTVITLLKDLSISKKSPHSRILNDKRDACLGQCEEHLKQSNKNILRVTVEELRKKSTQTLELPPLKEDMASIIKKASQDKRAIPAERHSLDASFRTQSSMSLVPSPLSPNFDRKKITRGPSLFNLFHGSPDKPSHPHRISPHLPRRRPRHTEGSDSQQNSPTNPRKNPADVNGSPTGSPTTPPKQKIRKREEAEPAPPINSGSPPRERYSRRPQPSKETTPAKEKRSVLSM